MARSHVNDFFQQFRFQVVERSNFLNPVAGFNSVGTPDVSVAEVMYREGTYTYTRKQSGIPEFSNITLRRGIARTPTDFWNWVLNAIEGREYRTDLEIQHFHRTDQKAPSATYRCLEAIVTRYKPSDDLAADSSEVAMEELEFAYESMEVRREGGGGGVTPPTAQSVGAGTTIRASGV